MGLLIAIDDAEGVLAARRKKEVMSANGILDDPQHHVAAVGVEWIALCEVDAAGVVEGASRGDELVDVVGVESEQIRYLATLRVDDCQALTFFQGKRCA